MQRRWRETFAKSRARGSIFISYRREDSQHLAGRLRDRLIQEYSPSRVFFDIDSIEPGLDFAEAIERAVAGCDLQLVLIGTRWLIASDVNGRRIDDPDDVVTSEIRAALVRNIRVVPVLIDGALMPRDDELPTSIASLVRRNSIRVDHETFDSDVGRLLDLISRVVRDGSTSPSIGDSSVRTRQSQATATGTTPPPSPLAADAAEVNSRAPSSRTELLLNRARRVLIWLGLAFSSIMLMGAVGATLGGYYKATADAIAGNLLFGALVVFFVGWLVVDIRRVRRRKSNS